MSEKGNFDANDFVIAKPYIPPSPQEYAFETLMGQVKKFEAETTENEVVGAMLASFGQSVVLHIHSIRRAGQFIWLQGITSEGNTATLMQHFTQTSLLFINLPKAPSEVKRPIGFLPN